MSDTTAGITLVIVGIVALVLAIFYIWGLIDCATQKNMATTPKVIWIVVILFIGGGIAGAVWLFWGRKHMEKWQDTPTNVAPAYGEAPNDIRYQQ